jgi:hypothetical protein
LHDFKALTFDGSGRLIDCENGMIEGLVPRTSKLSQPLLRDAVLLVV